jgi:Ca2+-binding EF-hand superfamily protein
MDVNKDGLVSKDEFLKFMLVALQKVDKESLDDLCRVFDSLYVSLSGMIGKEDLQQISRTERRKLTRDEFHQAEVS